MRQKEEIRSLLDSVKIEDILGNFLTFKKNGNKLWTCCPFHNEKTPSFCISPDLEIYKCFGCGESGDILKFLQKFLSISFSESVEYLANLCGVQLKFVNYEIQKNNDTDEKIFKVLNLANNFFIESLKRKNKIYKYLENRKISSESIDKFQIGYAEDSWDNLLSFFKKENLDMETLEKTGLFIEKNSTYYDRFRNRITFPIHNLMGQVVAFGARILEDGKEQAKYINSPENSFFEKRKTLYGIFQAKKAIRQINKCFILEGYTDVIALSESNIENGVASMGTSLTIEQIQLIKRYTQNVTMIFDGDTAGIKSAFKNLPNLLHEGLYANIVPMPKGEDPHSLFFKNGKDFLKTYITENEQDFVTFKADFLYNESKNETVATTLAIKEISSDISEIKDEVYKIIVAQKCAKIFDVTPELFLEKQKEKKKEQKIAFRGKSWNTNNQFFEENKIIILDKTLQYNELEFFKILFCNAYKKINPKETIANIAFKILEDYSFSSNDHTTIWNICKKLITDEIPLTINNFEKLEYLEENVKNKLTDLLISRYSLSEKWEKSQNNDEKNESGILYKNFFKILYNMKISLIRKLKEENLKNLILDNNEKYMKIHEEFCNAEKKINLEIKKIK